MIGSLTNRLETVYRTATKTEKRLMETLEGIKPTEVALMSITELAARLEVVESTVSRFCRKLDYKSFQEFKLAYMHEYGADISGADGYLKDIAEKMTEAVKETCLGLDKFKVEEVARRIATVGKVCIFGTSNSSIAAGALRVKLLRTGINADASSDFHLQRVAVKNLTKNDLLILFTASGNTREMIELAETAMATGTPLAVVTSYDKSQIAEYADWLFLSSRKEVRYDEVSLASVVAQLYVADILGAAVERVKINK